jgi:hypothetical protein
MKKALILLTSALAMLALAAAPGCSGGGDDDDDDDDDGGSGLASGTYAATGASLADECFGGAATDSYYAGVSEADVTVTGVAVEIEGFADTLGYDISGTSLVDNTFGTPDTFVIDFTDPATLESATGANDGNTYACMADYFVEYAGSITGGNEFTLEDTTAVSASATTGAGCTIAIVSSAFSAPLAAFPCETIDSVDLAL